MQIHQLKKNIANKKARQVGRGGKRGKTSGKGTKGQNARSGRKKRPEMRDFIKRLPKLRGRGKNFLKSVKDKFFVLDATLVEKNFSPNDVINPTSLFDKGLVNKKNGKLPKIKVLNTKSLSKEFKFEKVYFSKSVNSKSDKK